MLLANAPLLRFAWPVVAHIELTDLWPSLVLLALPQLPLSLANSIYATEKTAGDLFPHRRVSAGGLALTYAAMNLLAPLAGGVPVCHGAGGIAGHHAFGGRTGGSVLLCGLAFLTVGLLASDGFGQLINFIPLPTLGVLLGFESLAMGRLAAGVPDGHGAIVFVLAVGLVAAFVPYGFGIALLAGMLACGLWKWRKVNV
jgi:MFS superfamily sulfate permease-like transporter